MANNNLRSAANQTQRNENRPQKECEGPDGNLEFSWEARDSERIFEGTDPTQFPSCALTSEASQCVMCCSPNEQIRGLGNLPRIPTGGGCHQRLCQRAGCSPAGLPRTHLRLGSQLSEAAQLCNAAQLRGPPEPGVPHRACVCVFAGLGTTLPSQSAPLKATAQSAFQNSPSAKPLIIL